MLPMLDIDIPNSNPDAGRVSGVTIHPLSEETPPWEDKMVFQRRPKREKARADGYYTKGKGKFKIKKGRFLPAQYDTVIYYDDKDYEREERVTTSDFRAGRIARETTSATADETTADAGEDAGEAVAPKKTTQKAKTTK
jgi:hypothetical protein